MFTHSIIAPLVTFKVAGEKEEFSMYMMHSWEQVV